MPHAFGSDRQNSQDAKWHAGYPKDRERAERDTDYDGFRHVIHVCEIVLITPWSQKPKTDGIIFAPFGRLTPQPNLQEPLCSKIDGIEQPYHS